MARMWVEPNEDELSCTKTQHHALGEVRTSDRAIKSPKLYQLCSKFILMHIIFQMVYMANGPLCAKFDFVESCT